MNSIFKIHKYPHGIEIDGTTIEFPASLDDATRTWAVKLAELAFTAGERKQMLEQLHASRVSRERLAAIAPLVRAEISNTSRPIRVADPLT